MAGLEQFYREVQRRRVFRVAFVYAAVAFIIWQAAEIAVPALNLPEWILTFVVLVTLLGFPIAVALGWAFDITPEGVRRTQRSHTASGVGWRVPRWLRQVEVIVLVLAGLFLLVWWPWGKPDRLAAFSEISFVDSVAVLPIENRTGDEGLDDLCVGINEEIVSHLKRVGTLKIVDPYSVQRLRALDLSPQQLADSLQVQKLIFGSLFRSLRGVTLNVRVSDGHSAHVLSANRYDGDSSAGFETASSLAYAFVNDFLGNATIRLAMSAEAPSPQGLGYDHYAVGNSWLGRRTPEGVARARTEFSKALEVRPDYAYAYSGLSKAYMLADTYRYRTNADGYRTLGLALALAERSIELEPNLADGYRARIVIERRASAPSAVVAADCERALELEPGDPDVLSWCAQTLIHEGNIEAGLQAAEQGVALNPQNAGRRIGLAYVALSLGLHEEAAREARMARLLQPGLMLPRAIEGWALLLEGKAEDCSSLDMGLYAVVLATCLHELGRVADAKVVVDSVESGLMSGTLEDSLYTAAVHLEALAVHHAWLGDAGAALAWLRRAYEESPSGIDTRVLGSGLFERVRQDPTFVRNVGLIQADMWQRVQTESRIAYQQVVSDTGFHLPTFVAPASEEP